MIATALGLVFGNFVFDVLVGEPYVGIVRIDTVINSETAPKIAEMLKHVAEEKTIKAAVLEIDSPGGMATSTEELYLQIMELRKKKPIVAHVTTVGASGGYYIAVAADLIYANPSSILGSVGAIVQLPEKESMLEEFIWTGPFKKTGSSTKEAVNRLEMLKERFVQIVSFQRGERLKISQEEISKAGIYNGIQAIRLGLIDEIGSSSNAIQAVAQLAGLRNYSTVDINKKLDLSLPSSSTFSWNAQDSKINSNILPTYYYQYMPPEAQE